MTFSGSLAISGGSLNYNPGDIVALPSGALTLSGSDYIVPQVQLTTGTMALFTYNYGTPNIPIYRWPVPTGSTRQIYTFAPSGGTVSLAVSGNAGNLSWSGAGNVWYSGTAATRIGTTRTAPAPTGSTPATT